MGSAQENLVFDVLVHFRLVGERDDATLVVGPRPLVVQSHEAVALEIGDRGDRSVDRKLAVVDTESVTIHTHWYDFASERQLNTYR